MKENIGTEEEMGQRSVVGSKHMRHGARFIGSALLILGLAGRMSAACAWTSALNIYKYGGTGRGPSSGDACIKIGEVDTATPGLTVHLDL